MCPMFNQDFLRPYSLSPIYDPANRPPTPTTRTIADTIMPPPPAFPSIFTADWEEKFREKRAERLHRSLLQNNWVKFSYDFIKSTAPLLPLFKKRCQIPVDVRNYHVVDATDVQTCAVACGDLKMDEVIGYDSEHCSYNTPFATWPSSYLKEWGFVPSSPHSKGNFLTMMQFASPSGYVYVFDCRKGLCQPLLDLMEDKSVVKIGWGVKSDNLAMYRTFGFGLNDSFVDLQRMAQSRLVNNGNPTALADYAFLFADKDVRSEKDNKGKPLSHYQRFNPPRPWTELFTPEYSKMLSYSAHDALFPVRIAAGMAFTNIWPRYNSALRQTLLNTYCRDYN